MLAKQRDVEPTGKCGCVSISPLTLQHRRKAQNILHLNFFTLAHAGTLTTPILLHAYKLSNLLDNCWLWQSTHCRKQTHIQPLLLEITQ